MGPPAACPSRNTADKSENPLPPPPPRPRSPKVFFDGGEHKFRRHFLQRGDDAFSETAHGVAE